MASGTDPNCTVIHHQGETVTFSGIGIGRFSGATFYYPTVINPRNCGTPMYMAQMPSGVSCASHCGTAYILPDAGVPAGQELFGL